MIQYDPHDWRSHLFDIRGSMLREIVGRVTLCVAWSLVVVLLHKYVVKLAIPVTPHSLLGTALGLLLVFRTNSSYERFWEGRKLWGGIVNECRNLARMARAMIPEEHAATTREIVAWTAAFPVASMQSLRGQTGPAPALADLPADAAQAIFARRRAPQAVAQRVTDLLAGLHRQGVISDIVLTAIDQNMFLLIDYFGGCERIHKTPIPFAYMVHLRRALILYCYTLPLALVDGFGWSTILVTLLVTYVFLGIEEIGVEIEDPFGEDENDLPMEAICQTITGDLTSQ